LSRKYFFISDIHLGLQDKKSEDEKETKLVKLLEYISNEADELFILGDLFDYWFEYKRVYQKGNFRTLTALHKLVQKKIKVYYFIGNHDFLHKDFFTEELGVNLIDAPRGFILDSKKFFMAHGDGMVANDIGYKILKKIIRNKFMQNLYSVIHPDLGIKLASSTSKKSRDYTSNKNYGEIDGLLETAKHKIDEGYDYVIFGHSHNRAHKEYQNGLYINLGTWLDKPCYGLFHNNKFEIIDWVD